MRFRYSARGDAQIYPTKTLNNGRTREGAVDCLAHKDCDKRGHTRPRLALELFNWPYTGLDE